MYVQHAIIGTLSIHKMSDIATNTSPRPLAQLSQFFTFIAVIWPTKELFQNAVPKRITNAFHSRLVPPPHIYRRDTSLTHISVTGYEPRTLPISNH